MGVRETDRLRERERENCYTALNLTAPNGSPNITTVSSTRLREIDLSWTIVLPDLQNGLITSYTVQFQTQDGTSSGNKTVTELSTILDASNGVMAGVTYSITVFASTAIGPGPRSAQVTQGTIVEPEDIAMVAERISVITGSISQTTIPIRLPSIPGATSNSFSHFWVIAMKVDDSFAMSIQNNNTVRFPDGREISDNSSFAVYSDDIRVNTPYIVAEISASIFSSTINFILGDEANTQSLNDEPAYRNGPLAEGTQYTVFLWGFPPSVAVSMILYIIIFLL